MEPDKVFQYLPAEAALNGYFLKVFSSKVQETF